MISARPADHALPIKIGLLTKFTRHKFRPRRQGRVSLADFSILGPEQKAGRLAVYRVVIKVGAIRQLCSENTVGHRATEAGDNLADRDFMATFDEALGDPGRIDGWRFGAHEKQAYDISGLLCLPDEIDFLSRRENRFEGETRSPAERLVPFFLGFPDRLQNGFWRIPISKLISSNLVRVDVETIFEPLMSQPLLRQRCLAHPFGPATTRRRGLMAGDAVTDLIPIDRFAACLRFNASLQAFSANNENCPSPFSSDVDYAAELFSGFSLFAIFMPAPPLIHNAKEPCPMDLGVRGEGQRKSARPADHARPVFGFNFEC